MTNLLALFISLAISTSHICQYIAEEFGTEFAQNYNAAIEAHDKMWESYPFPDYYAGHYFCEGGNFHLNLTQAESETFSELADNVQVVENSHKELLEIAAIITEYAQKTPDCQLKLTAWGLDTRNNCVVVYLQDITDDAAEIFAKEVTDSPVVRLTEGNPVATLVPRALVNPALSQTAETIEPGTRIYIGNFGFSAGYPALRGNTPGFVTALHGLPLEHELVRYGSPTGPIIGQVADPIKFENAADGAFITLEDANFSHTADGKPLTPSHIRPAQGMILASISTPPIGDTHIQRNIVVTNAHFSANFGDGLVLTDLIQTTGTAMYGESGGLVVRFTENTAEIMGIIVGSNSATNANMFFAWADSVDKAVDVTPE